MGIFDFFKKKETNKNKKTNDTKKEQSSSDELDGLVMSALNLLCDDVSTIKDAKLLISSKGYNEKQTEFVVNKAEALHIKFFKDKCSDKSKQNITTQETEPKKSINDIYAEKLEKKKSDKTTSKEVEVISHYTGTHGDNFAALLGFEYLNTNDGTEFLNSSIAHSCINPSIHENNDISVNDLDFSVFKGNSEQIGLRTIKADDQIFTSFPILTTNKVIPFETTQIIEWSHIGNYGAEIKGAGRETFGLGFFAKDYAINKNKYLESKSLNVRISAFCLALVESNLNEINGTKVSSDFASYMPSKDIPRVTYYDFIGKVIDFKKINLTKDNLGYIIEIKLINHEDQPDFFNVELFVNQENMRFSSLTKGMNVSGLLWFQGEIV